MDAEINVLALVKGEERFIFLFDDGNRDETLRQLARFAADPEIDFSWYDAAMLSRKIRDAVPLDDDAPIPPRVEKAARAPLSDRR
jgi:hypothetical protein